MPYTVQIECLSQGEPAVRHPIVREVASEGEAREIMLVVAEDARQTAQALLISAYNPDDGLIATCSVDYRGRARVS